MMEEPAPGGGAKTIRHGRAIAVIGIPGDRRDQDQRDYGAWASTAFDEIVIREDRNRRGRAPGEAASNVSDGIHAKMAKHEARTTRVEKILDEAAAVHRALHQAVPGDLVVVCADDTANVYREAMALGHGSGGTAYADPGELE
jgi:cyanophycin synthetase